MEEKEAFLHEVKGKLSEKSYTNVFDGYLVKPIMASGQAEVLIKICGNK